MPDDGPLAVRQPNSVQRTGHIDSHNGIMTGGGLLRILRRQFGCEEVRQKGSHVIVRCATCQTTIPVHAGEDLGPGLLSKIQRDLEACLGVRWLRRIR